MTKQWTVLGAGAAGILAVGKLLDSGIHAQDISWIDPHFNVGDLGKKWFNVSSNTKIIFFEKFLQSSPAFKYQHCPKELSFADMDPERTCLLKHIVAPLRWITQHLMETVNCIHGTANSIKKVGDVWRITASNNTFTSKNIILATGATPKSLPYEGNFETLSLTQILNPEVLPSLIDKQDTVAIFGSSHSAILAIKNVIDCGARVINFYKEPLRYAIYKEDHIVYDNTGLKGLAASWAQQNIDKEQHPLLTRYSINDCKVSDILAGCTKVAFTIGFSPRTINIVGQDINHYDNRTGVITEGLYGLGIAFPEFCVDRYGNQEFSIGLFKFAKYIERVMPLWIAKSHARCSLLLNQ